jgi:hypothetical protein
MHHDTWLTTIATGGECIQTISHPCALWGLAVLPNGVGLQHVVEQAEQISEPLTRTLTL